MGVFLAGKTRSWLVATWVASALVAGGLQGQATGTIAGVVTDAESGQPINSAQVYLPGLQIGAITNAQGRFLLLNVPAGQHQIKAELIGRAGVSQVAAVTAGTTVTVNFVLESRAISLDELVVTGVAAATPKSQLAFTVDQVQVSAPAVASALNMSSLIQGRMSGARIIQGSGQPGDEPSVQLRGPTSIMGSQAPLLIVDGVISQGTLASIDPNDIANIEVVRGAAAASLYGSRAQAGVIQVTTKRGTGLGAGRTEFTMRGSYMMNDVPYLMRMSLSHEFKMNPAGTKLLLRNGQEADLLNRNIELSISQLALNDGGNGTNPAKTFQDQVIPADIYGGSPFEAIMNPGNAYTTYFSASGNEGNTQYRLSARYTRDQGTVRFHDGSKQQNYRINLDHSIGSKVHISAGTYLAWVNQDVLFQNESSGLSNIDAFGSEPVDPTGASGGGAARGIFKGIDEQRAAGRYLDRDTDGDLYVIGDVISRGANPLFIVKNQDWTRQRQRTMAVLDIEYKPLSWFTLQGNVAHDRSALKETDIEPAPWKQAPPRPPLLGSMFVMDQLQAATNGSVTASIAQDVGALTIRTRFRYLAELADISSTTTGGNTFAAIGVPRLGLLTTGLYEDSEKQKTRSEGFFVANALTWKERYIVDGLIRRDGSSLFGPDQRWQTYHRIALAWRLAQEPWWPLASVTELRPHFSIGTAGNRPGFDYQYQTYKVERGRIAPLILGNPDLKPELATEKELGLDFVFKDLYRLQVSHVNTTVEDQLLVVSPSAWLGFQGQWKNAGTVQSKTWELSLETTFAKRADLLWTGTLNVDRTRQKITKLNVPPFEMREVRARVRVAEGESLGTFYGFVFARTCADLPKAQQSLCDQFTVNDDGLLVYTGKGNDWRDGVKKNLWGTSANVGGTVFGWGQPIQADGKLFNKIGSAEPDLNVSFIQDLQFRQLGFSALFSSQIGGDIYNQSRQWGVRSAIGPIDQYGKPTDTKKPMPYYVLGLYFRNDRSDWWVESGTYVKLRELSARYTLDQSNLPSMLQQAGLSRATISLVGRNVLTWTGYAGHDPEVGKASIGGSASVGRIDEYTYPNLRQMGLDVELVF